MTRFSFRGLDRNGTHVVGRMKLDPVAFTEAKFKARWQSLEIRNDDDEIVAEINHCTDDERRTWWATDIS